MLLALPATVLGSLADMCVQYEAGQVRFATIDSSSELPHRWSSVVTLKRAAHYQATHISQQKPEMPAKRPQSRAGLSRHAPQPLGQKYPFLHQHHRPRGDSNCSLQGVSAR